MNKLEHPRIYDLINTPFTVSCFEDFMNPSTYLMRLKDEQDCQLPFTGFLAKDGMDNLAVFCRSFLDEYIKIYPPINQ